MTRRKFFKAAGALLAGAAFLPLSKVTAEDVTIATAEVDDAESGCEPLTAEDFWRAMPSYPIRLNMRGRES